MYKVGENRKCTESPQTELEHLTVESIPYTLNTYPWGPNFGPFCSIYGQWFPRYRTFYNSPLTTMLNVPPPKKKKKEKKMPNFKSHYSFNNFGRDKEYTRIMGRKSGVFFQRRFCLKLLPPYGAMLTKKKGGGGVQNVKFHNYLNNFRDPPPPPEYAWFFGGVNLMRTFRRDVVWFFSSTWSY